MFSKISCLLSQPLLSLAMLIPFLMVGCGGGWQAPTYPVSGSILINGEPPIGAVVELRNVGDSADNRNSRPWGVVNEIGTYTLTTYEPEDGAPVGDYAITIRWPPSLDRPSLEDRLNKAYSDPAKSEWKVTITQGENEIPMIELTDIKVTSVKKFAQSGKALPGPKMGP